MGPSFSVSLYAIASVVVFWAFEKNRHLSQSLCTVFLKGKTLTNQARESGDLLTLFWGYVFSRLVCIISQRGLPLFLFRSPCLFLPLVSIFGTVVFWCCTKPWNLPLFSAAPNLASKANSHSHQGSESYETETSLSNRPPKARMLDAESLFSFPPRHNAA